MDIKLVILIIFGSILCVYGLYLLYNMPYDMMKKMEKEVKDYIVERDKKNEEKQKLIHDIKKWLFS